MAKEQLCTVAGCKHQEPKGQSTPADLPLFLVATGALTPPVPALDSEPSTNARLGHLPHRDHVRLEGHLHTNRSTTLGVLRRLA